jgi:hypothetical protein
VGTICVPSVHLPIVLQKVPETPEKFPKYAGHTEYHLQAKEQKKHDTVPLYQHHCAKLEYERQLHLPVQEPSSKHYNCPDQLRYPEGSLRLPSGNHFASFLRNVRGK